MEDKSSSFKYKETSKSHFEAVNNSNAMENDRGQFELFVPRCQTEYAKIIHRNDEKINIYTVSIFSHKHSSDVDSNIDSNIVSLCSPKSDFSIRNSTENRKSDLSFLDVSQCVDDSIKYCSSNSDSFLDIPSEGD